MVVGFATKDGSAHRPADYGFTKGFLVFLPGQRAKTVGVKVKADVLAEENEAFLLKVSAADNVAIADGTGRATIVDDD